MWICFNDAFISIVQDRDDPKGFVVRARRRDHLQRVFGPNVAVVVDAGSDYRYRAFLPKSRVIDVIMHRLVQTDYPNFKASVADRELHDLYLGFWMDAARYQDDEPPPQTARKPVGGGKPQRRMKGAW